MAIKKPINLVCTKCGLHKFRRQIVVGRGDKPADMLFIGEAPTKTEDLLGKPFIGPSGKLLDQMINDAVRLTGSTITPSYYITNTVLCRPTDEKYGENREPNSYEVAACTPNILDIVAMVQPRIVVFVGKISEHYYKREFPHSVFIQHPVFLLKQGGKASSWYQGNIQTLAEVFSNLWS